MTVICAIVTRASAQRLPTPAHSANRHSTFSRPASARQVRPSPLHGGHLTDIACMPVQLQDAAAVYGASPLSTVLPSPSPRQPLTAAAPCRCPTPIISGLRAQHTRRSPFQQKGFNSPASADPAKEDAANPSPSTIEPAKDFWDTPNAERRDSWDINVPRQQL